MILKVDASLKKFKDFVILIEIEFSDFVPLIMLSVCKSFTLANRRKLVLIYLCVHQSFKYTYRR